VDLTLGLQYKKKEEEREKEKENLSLRIIYQSTKHPITVKRTTPVKDVLV
jgi:hypothetical protein